MSKLSSRKTGKFEYVLPRRRDLNILQSGENLPALNALSIGSWVFELEKKSQKRFIDSAILPLYGQKTLEYDLSSLQKIIRELLLFVLVQDPEISVKNRRQRKVAKDKKTIIQRSQANVCLFSGGIDSYSGILVSQERLREVHGVFCAHSDQARIIHIVKKLERKLDKIAGLQFDTVKVPSIGVRGYAQLRGFLYVLASAVWLHLLDARKLVVTECGPTMYQPRFSPYDSVTMTTHPVVLNCARKIICHLLKRPIDIITPFEDFTKAEVMVVCPDQDGLRFTHSCVSQRFGDHDGTCYGCVIRRLAGIAVGIRDVRYRRNPLQDRSANAGNLMTLLTFCFDLLTNYSRMEYYEVENIKTFNKLDFFKRFALDNFSAIHRLISEKKRVSPAVKQIYDLLKERIGTSPLEDRLELLRKGNFTPRF